MPSGHAPFVSTPSTTVFSTPSLTPPDVPNTNVTFHGPYTGPPPTTTGAFYPPLSTTALASRIPARPPGPDAFKYPADGKLHAPEPVPYMPAGGLNTNGSAPMYRPMSDFDYQSVALALYQEWIELDLFHWGLARFSVHDFTKAGLTAGDRFLIEFMDDQDVGHATLLASMRMLGRRAPRQDMPQLLTFRLQLTRFGEAGSITVEVRQQLIFRQFEVLIPMPEWFEVGIPQSWAWTLVAPYISSCPGNWNETLGDYLNSLNTIVPTTQSCLNKTETGVDCSPAVTNNRTNPLSYAGRQVFLSKPKFAMWLSQLNATFTPLMNISGNTAWAIQPNMSTYAGDPAANGTIFLAITDEDLYVTPHNMTQINPHVRTLSIYQAG
ncbi:hypothetical protein GE09DRAFT_1260266 [Coniochaeta sp. 2T2.1]|nr:hypothetical protein GE09DRAFT_1260266 [Coniochaeta sp. 2T2.1]